MKQSLKNALPIAEGISKLMHPFAEVVLHDLEHDRIEAIFNPFSRREVGDESYLSRMRFNDTDSVIGPYEKINWDGKKLKCISIILRDEKTNNSKCNAAGFICINLDVSHFERFSEVISSFLNNNAEMTEEDELLFKDDLYEKINTYVQQYCRKNNTSLSALTREQKKELVKLLEQSGAFNSKNAATYIGRVLGISRATVYNYLNKN